MQHGEKDMSQDVTQTLCVRPVAERDSPRVAGGGRSTKSQVAEGVKPGLGPQISVLPRTFGSARRKYAANFGNLERTTIFMKKTQVEALSLSSVVGMSRICRTLLV